MEHSALVYTGSLHMLTNTCNGTASQQRVKTQHNKHIKAWDKTVSSTVGLLRTEAELIKEVQTKCKYPAWALEQMEC